MPFAEELDRVLPADIPRRSNLIEKAVQHLTMVAQANETMNLTRVTNAREAAIKHVLDSVLPWTYFKDAKRVLDAGTGAGFPGVPLAVVLPEVRFTLVESVQKKARFLDAAVESLHLPNVHVSAERAEVCVASTRPEIVTARAVAPLSKLLDLFEKALKQGVELVLYKGPEVEAEISSAKMARVEATVLSRYELPDELGTRTIVRVRYRR